MTATLNPQTNHAAGPYATERFFAIGGFVFAALTLGAIALQRGESPDQTASAAKVAAFFLDHGSRVRISEACAAVGLGALVWWFGGVWRVIRSEERTSALPTIAAIGFAAGLALAFVDVTMFGAAAVGASSLSTSELQALNEASVVAVLLSGFGVGTFLAATCAINARIRAFPAWTNVLGWIAAAGWFVGGTAATATTSSAVLSAGYAAFVLWCIWIVAVSVSMLRQSR